MSNIQIVDAFPSFLAWWQEAQGKSVDDKIESWAADYMSSWPELLSLQISDYEAMNLDWRQITREQVFPHLGQRLARMRQAHHGLQEQIEPLYRQAQQVLGFESDVVFVIYVGIGCGAGWMTKYAGLPAVLFGLENIAELGWSELPALKGLIAHELGHLAHYHWREQVEKPIGSGPWWQLYEEGFAQVCESLILGATSWHQAHGDAEWLDWCQHHQSWLAATFLEMVDRNEPVDSFFGSWYALRGKSQTGYFLGHQVVNALLEEMGLREIALLEDIESNLRPKLEQMVMEIVIREA